MSRPPLAPGAFGNPPNGGTAMPKLDCLIGMFKSDVNVPAGVKPVMKRLGSNVLGKLPGANWLVVNSGAKRWWPESV
jgi:hypothetical protein